MSQHPAESDGPAPPPDHPASAEPSAVPGWPVDADPPPPPQTPTGPPGASTFTIEGRAAPALFVIAWLTSLLGLAIAVAGLLGSSPLLFAFVGCGLLSVGLVAACGNQAFERRAHGASYAGPSPFLVFGAIIAITIFVGSIVGVVLGLVTGGRAAFPPVAQLLAAILTGVVFVGVVRLTVVGTGALSWADMQWRRFSRRALDDLAIGAATAVPVIIATSFLAAILVAIFQVEPESPLPPTGTTGGLILQLLTGAVIVPVYEELVFRGFAITAWERSIGPRRAVIRATLLFALAHVIGIEVPSDSTALQAVGLVVMGAATRLPVAYVLGLLYVRRRSIWAPIGLHATFNGLLLILAHIYAVSGGA
ncbi:MAG TPA: type II CAAX endopeptidase family protein [Candidatus Limnocylindrales bacterium]|nr:type II CAAX endopeptidase family protein [Candidatus Limnocylindrales bacterium]